MRGLGEAIYKQGIEQGYEQGKLKILVSLVKDGLLNLSDAARRANMSEEEFLQLMEGEEKSETFWIDRAKSRMIQWKNKGE